MIHGRHLLQRAALIRWSTMTGTIMVNMGMIITTGHRSLNGPLVYTTPPGRINAAIVMVQVHIHTHVSCFKVNLGELGEPRRTDHLVPFPPRNRK
jgi:hypothetical protein